MNNLPDNISGIKCLSLKCQLHPMSTYKVLDAKIRKTFIKGSRVWAKSWKTSMIKVLVGYAYACVCTNNRHICEFYIFVRKQSFSQTIQYSNLSDPDTLSSINKRLTGLFMSPGWWLNNSDDFQPTLREKKCKCDRRPLFQAFKGLPCTWS